MTTPSTNTSARHDVIEGYVVFETITMAYNGRLCGTSRTRHMHRRFASLTVWDKEQLSFDRSGTDITRTSNPCATDE
jgi:hypothetical protein